MNTNLHLYDRDRPWHAYLADSYWGGDRYRNPSSPTLGVQRIIRYELAVVDSGPNAGKEEMTERSLGTFQSYLVPHDGETVEGFRRRVGLGAYLNVVGPIVDTYTGSVTARVERDLGPLGDYLVDLDGQGGDWAQHVKEAARWACVHGVVATVLDAPAENPARNAAEERALGVGLRAVLVVPTAWAWLDVDLRGSVTEFAFADQAQADPTAIAQRVRVYVYDREGWRVYQHDASTAQGLTAQRGAICSGTPVASGQHPAGVRGRVPVVFAFHRRDSSSRAPRGASLIADAADLARQAYNVLSGAEESIRKTLFPFLAVPTKGSGAAQLEPEVAVKLGPSSPFPYSSDTGQPAWIDGPTGSIAAAREHALFLLAMALRFAGLEAALDPSHSPESGKALQVRSRGFEARAQELAGSMASYERQALDLAGAFLAIQQRASVQYGKRFTLPDASEDLDRAVTVLKDVASLLGPGGVEASVRQALSAALSLSDDELAKVMAEVRAKLAPKPVPVEPPAANPEQPAGAAAPAGGA